MHHWHQVAGIPFDTFLSADQLHMKLWLHRQAAGELNRKFGQRFDLDQSPLRIGQELDYLDGRIQRFWDTDGERTDAAVKAIGRQG